MNKTIAMLGFTGLSIMLFTSAAFAQNLADTTQVSKTHHVKLMKIENGKKMELDTVLTADNFLVWDGDTINLEEETELFFGPEPGKRHRFGMNVEDNNGNRTMTVRHYGKGEDDEPLFLKFDFDDDFPKFFGDDVPGQKKIRIHRRMKDGDNEASAFMDQSGSKYFCPMDLDPYNAKMRHSSRGGGRVIDLNDPNIISFKKKKLSGGREKIEIIRKKSDPNEMSFDFNIEDQLDMPEPPDAPDSVRQIDCGDHKLNMREKEIPVNGNSGKEYKVEVTAEENK